MDWEEREGKGVKVLRSGWGMEGRVWRQSLSRKGRAREWVVDDIVEYMGKGRGEGVDSEILKGGREKRGGGCGVDPRVSTRAKLELPGF